MGILLATGQKTGTVATGSGTSLSTTLAMPGNVTSGNTLIVPVYVYADNGTLSQPAITKSSGTATIGTPVADIENSSFFGDGASRGVIWRIPITGSGSLTIQGAFTCASSPFNAIDLDVAEFSGFHATPKDTTDDKSGTGATESTNAITTVGSGLIVMLSSEQSSGDFTYTLSDTPIHSEAHGSSTLTSQSQYKLNSGTGPFTMTAGTGNSWLWRSIAVAYKEAGGGGGGRTLFNLSAMDGLSTSGPKQFNPLQYHRHRLQAA